MSELTIGLLIGVATLVVLGTGIPVAFGLGVVAVGFMIAFDGLRSIDYRSEEHTSELQSRT